MQVVYLEAPITQLEFWPPQSRNCHINVKIVGTVCIKTLLFIGLSFNLSRLAAWICSLPNLRNVFPKGTDYDKMLERLEY
jgi:hypothetical protein